MSGPGPVDARLAEVRKLLAERDLMVERLRGVRTIRVSVAEFNAAQDRLAECVPALLAALEVVQGIASAWGAETVPSASQAGSVRAANTLRACGASLQQAIFAALRDARDARDAQGDRQ